MKKSTFLGLVILLSVSLSATTHNYSIRIYMPEICDEFAVYKDSVCVKGDFASWQGQLATAQQDEQGVTYYGLQLTGIEEGTRFAVRLGRAENNRKIMCGLDIVPDLTFTQDTDVVIQYQYGCYIYGCSPVNPYVKRTSWDDITNMVTGFYSGSSSSINGLKNALITETSVLTENYSKSNDMKMDSILISYDVIKTFYTDNDKVREWNFPYYGHRHAQQFNDKVYNTNYYLFAATLSSFEDIAEKVKGTYVTQTGADTVRVFFDEETQEWLMLGSYKLKGDTIQSTNRIRGYFEEKDGKETKLNIVARNLCNTFIVNEQGDVTSVKSDNFVYYPYEETALNPIAYKNTSARKVMKDGQFLIQKGDRYFNILGAQER